MSPVLSLGKQNSLVGCQSNSNTDVDEESCPNCVINRGYTYIDRSYHSLYTYSIKVKLRYRSFIMKLAIGKQSVCKMKMKRSRTIFPEREGDVTMLLIIINVY